MPLIQIIKPFSFAHHGYQVEVFDPADAPRETSAECAEIAVREGWAQPVQASAPAHAPARRAHAAAPENKDAAAQRRTKAAAA